MKPETLASAAPKKGGRKNSRHARSLSFASKLKRSAVAPKVKPVPLQRRLARLALARRQQVKCKP